MLWNDHCHIDSHVHITQNQEIMMGCIGINLSQMMIKLLDGYMSMYNHSTITAHCVQWSFLMCCPCYYFVYFSIWYCGHSYCQLDWPVYYDWLVYLFVFILFLTVPWQIIQVIIVHGGPIQNTFKTLNLFEAINVVYRSFFHVRQYFLFLFCFLVVVEGPGFADLFLLKPFLEHIAWDVDGSLGKVMGYPPLWIGT